MRILARIAAIIDGINELIGQVISWLTVVVVLNVFIVVVMRYLFGVGHVWMQELYVWLHAGIFMIGASYTLLHDGHVRIDLIYREAGRRYKAVINLLGSIFLGLPFMWMLLMKALPMAQRSYEMRERSSEVGGLPGLYVLKSIIVVFALLMGLQLLSIIAKSLLTLFAADGNKGEAL